MDKRGYQDFPLKVFCLTLPRNFAGEPFGVSLFSGTENVCIRGGGEYQDFPFKIFRLTVPKNFVGEPFRVSLFWVPKKLMNKVGEYQDFRRNFFVSQCRVIS